MGKKFYELVIEGPFLNIKGFIYGLRAGSGTPGEILFSREENIKAETLVEHFMEWTHLQESVCHLVAEESLVKLIEDGLRNTADALHLRLKSMQEIARASFAFQYEVFAPHYGEEIKKLLSNLPPELKLSADYQAKEELDPAGKGIEAYAPCHEYRFQGQGEIGGPLDIVVSFFHRMQTYDLIKKEPIVLRFAEID